MFGAAAAYLVAFLSMAFAALSALTLINAVRHLDPPEGHAAAPAPSTNRSAIDREVATT